MAYSSGLFANYVLSVTWVFETRRLDSRFAELAIFAAVGIVGLAVTELVVWLFVEFLLVHYLLAKVISTGFAFPSKFFVRRHLLFR